MTVNDSERQQTDEIEEIIALVDQAMREIDRSTNRLQQIRRELFASLMNLKRWPE